MCDREFKRSKMPMIRADGKGSGISPFGSGSRKFASIKDSFNRSPWAPDHKSHRRHLDDDDDHDELDDFDVEVTCIARHSPRSHSPRSHRHPRHRSPLSPLSPLSPHHPLSPRPHKGTFRGTEGFEDVQEELIEPYTLGDDARYMWDNANQTTQATTGMSIWKLILAVVIILLIIYALWWAYNKNAKGSTKVSKTTIETPKEDARDVFKKIIFGGR